MERIRAGLSRRIRSAWERRHRDRPEKGDNDTNMHTWSDEDMMEEPTGYALNKAPVLLQPRGGRPRAHSLDRIKESALRSRNKETATESQSYREQKESLLQQSYPNGPCAACEMMASTPIFSHHDSGMLSASARAGCPVCKLLHQTPYVARYDSPAVIIVDHTRRCIHYESSSHQKLRVTLEMFIPDSHPVQSSQSDPKSSLKNLISVVSAREIHHHPDSAECYSLAKSWIQKCVSQHARCNQDGYGSPPTRILELVGDKIYLRRGDDIPEEKPLYATLSYCWGMAETMKTTRETLAQYEGGIELKELPLTLHDAVIVTRNLDLKYIWIDALCIIQNSQDDWEAECARMGDYYRYSYVTISPLRVQAADQGFLKERPANPTCPSVTLGGCHFGLRRPIRNDVKGSPLSKRGWALQERLLATRILHFGQDELLWECLTCSAREGSSVEETQSEDSSALVQSEGQDFKRCLYGLGPDPYAIQDGAFALWYRIVRSYSQRSLTYASDKLPAISAIAKAIGDQTGSDYLSGTFQSDLHGLVWCDRHDSSKSSFLAPSWSWASVEGPIKYPFHSKDRLGVENDAKFVSHDANLSSGCLTIQALSNKVVSVEQNVWANENTHNWVAQTSDSDFFILSSLDVESMAGNRRVRIDRDPFPSVLSIDSIENVTAISVCERSTRATEHLVSGNRDCDCRSPMLEIYTYLLLVVPDRILDGCWRRVGMGVSISVPLCADVKKQNAFSSSAEWNTFSLV